MRLEGRTCSSSLLLWPDRAGPLHTACVVSRVPGFLRADACHVRPIRMIVKPHSYARSDEVLMPLLKANGTPPCQLCQDLLSRLRPLTLHALGPGALTRLHPAHLHPAHLHPARLHPACWSHHDPLPPSSLPGMFFLPSSKLSRGGPLSTREPPSS